jgi:ribosomal protein S18 acetylase RimI-like enzyme
VDKLIIRPASSDDLEDIWRMWKDIMDQKVYFAFDDQTTKEDIIKSWINLNNHCFVAEKVNSIVGAYILKPNQPGYGKHIANASYLVDTTFRGGGIGHQLCVHSIESAKKIGFRGMQFNFVVSTNTMAIRIWERYGFEIIGTIPGGFYHVEKGYVDVYIFFKDLTND